MVSLTGSSSQSWYHGHRADHSAGPRQYRPKYLPSFSGFNKTYGKGLLHRKKTLKVLWFLYIWNNSSRFSKIWDCIKKTQMQNPIETQSVDRCFDADVMYACQVTLRYMYKFWLSAWQLCILQCHHLGQAITAEREGRLGCICSYPKYIVNYDD